MSSSVGNVSAIDNAAANTVHAATMQGQDTRPKVSTLKLPRPLSGLDEGALRISVAESLHARIARDYAYVLPETWPVNTVPRFLSQFLIQVLFHFDHAAPPDHSPISVDTDRLVVATPTPCMSVRNPTTLCRPSGIHADVIGHGLSDRPPLRMHRATARQWHAYRG